MTPIQIIFLVGICLFGAGMIINTIIGIVYFRNSHQHIDKLHSKDKYKKHWGHTLWVYGVLFLDFFLFLMLYIAQYFGQGISLNISGVYFTWARWLQLILIGFVNAQCLTYVMTRKSKDIQSKIYVFANFLAYLFFFFASISQLKETRSTWLAGSAFIFIVGVLAYVFPFNKWRVDSSKYHRDISNEPWGGYYHRAFYILYIVVYVIYFITWILAPVNGFTDMSFETEIGVYLVADVVPLLIMTLYIWVTTHAHMHQYLYIDNCQIPSYNTRAGVVKK